MNVKRGEIGAAAGALAGLLFALPPFWETPLCFPGLLVLRIFMAPWVIGHGGILWIVVTNPILYGALGLLVGAYLPVGRRTLLVFVGCVGLVALGGVGHRYGPRWVRQIKSSHRVQQAQARLNEDPNDVPALYQMGLYHQQHHGDLAAAEYYRKIVAIEAESEKLSPEAQRSLLSLAIICLFRGDRATGEEYHRRFLASEPDLDRDAVLSHNNLFYLNKKSLLPVAEARD